MVHVGCGVDAGCEAKAGVVGAGGAGGALLDDKGDCGADEAARGGGAGKGVAEDQGEGVGQVGDVAHDHNDAGEQPEDGHNRNQGAADLAHGLQTANAGEEHEQDHNAGDDVRIPAVGGLGGLDDGVNLHNGRHEDRVEEQADGEGLFKEFGVQTRLHVVHGAAVDLPVGGNLAVVYGEGDLRALDGHGEEGEDPHPENRAGSADSDGGRGAGDVAHSYRPGQRAHDRLELGQALGLRLLLLKELAHGVLHDIAKLSDRIEFCSNLEGMRR